MVSIELVVVVVFYYKILLFYYATCFLCTNYNIKPLKHKHGRHLREEDIKEYGPTSNRLTIKIQGKFDC